ncbi:COBRA-like protein, partial [Tanacetum coccineum]
QYLHVSPPRWTLCWTLAEKKVIWRIYGAQTTEQVLEEELKNTKERNGSRPSQSSVARRDNFNTSRGTKVLKEEIWNIEKRSEIHNGSRVEEQRAMDGLASALREVAT